MEIIEGRLQKPLKVVIYGPEGIGKTTFAAAAPRPLFIDVEAGSVHMDVRRLPQPTSFQMLLEEIAWIRANPGSCETCVVDTADWAEKLAREAVCAKYQKTGIEDFGYGKGYTYVYEEFGKLLNALEDLIGQGIHVIVTAHAAMRKFEQPDENGSYDRWELKLISTQKCSIANMLKEWADMVLFANYETIVVKNEEKKNKAQGGRRVMYTSHHPCWDAKNRFGLPDKLPLDFAQVAGLFYRRAINNGENGGQARLVPTDATGNAKEAERSSAERIRAFPTDATGSAEERRDVGAPSPTKDEFPLLTEPDPDLPFTYQDEAEDLRGVAKPLANLLQTSGITKAQLSRTIFLAGVLPNDVPVEQYPEDLIRYIVSIWDKIADAIRTKKFEN